MAQRRPPERPAPLARPHPKRITHGAVRPEAPEDTPEAREGLADEIGIEIDNGMGATIKLTGPQASINNGALDVT